MQHSIPVEELPSGPRTAAFELDARLARGPLRVRALWRPAQTRRLPKRVRNLRRKWLVTRLLAVVIGVSAALLAVFHWYR